MKLRLFLILTVALALFTTGAFAADVTGKWTAETKGRDGETRTQTFVLKQDGSALTGSVSSPMGDSQITEGKVDGDSISFVVKMERNGNEIKMPYTGKVVGNEIQFKRESPRGVQEFTAKKATT
jgi:opacity protein-like surface antigen